MWKPGCAKPTSSADLLKESPQTPSQASAKKGLSGATLGMRFMQKRNQQTHRPVEIETSSRRTENNGDASSERSMGHENNHCESLATVPVSTNSDMFGMQSDLIGRRSFGGFKPQVNKNWQDCRSYLVGEENQEKNGKHVTDEELLLRYRELVKGRSDHEKSSRTRRRKKSLGESSGVNKKTKL